MYKAETNSHEKLTLNQGPAKFPDPGSPLCRTLPAPVIHEVIRQDGRIRVNATDNVQVAKVRITIVNHELSEGQTLEHGEAAPAINDNWWEFETSTEGKLIVEVFDLAGNVTKFVL